MDDEPLSTEQAHTLWMLTADPDSWDLGDAPDWLRKECATLGLAFEAAPGVWRMTVKGKRLTQNRLGEAI